MNCHLKVVVFSKFVKYRRSQHNCHAVVCNFILLACGLNVFVLKPPKYAKRVQIVPFSETERKKWKVLLLYR